MGRRFDVVDTAAGITLVDDYGHHPAEVRAVLETARAHASRARDQSDPGAWAAIAEAWGQRQGEPWLSRSREIAARYRSYPEPTAQSGRR